MLLNLLREFLLSKTIILNLKERRRVNKCNIVLHILKENDKSIIKITKIIKEVI